MHKHHEESIDNITTKLRANDEVLALLVTGSIAHGFETPVSDIDIMILLAEDA